MRNNTNHKMLPVGIDSFREIRTEGFYYVDKTGMMKELLDNWGKVNLFTRPRRFGKSLNMSMLKSFFEIGADKSLFEGLTISEEKDLCHEYMGKYPVISITLKQVKGEDFATAEAQMRTAISLEADRFSFLHDSDRLDQIEKEILYDLRTKKGSLEDSLLQLSKLLYKHYEEKVIILIDEYDVPLEKAYANGYYRQMAALISQLFGYGMKSNEFMFFSVITGCLRISKESIFTGFNNPKMYTLVDSRCDEWFGFTEQDVYHLLAEYDLLDYYDITKDWYDGYLIGEEHIYCPWDVINWCDQLLTESDKTPRNYWANVSSNDIVMQFVEMADETTRAELEDLSVGKRVDKELEFELTYDEIYDNVDNLWSVLFTTGYLTHRGRNEDGSYNLVIPNREIMAIFDRQIKKWFYGRIEQGLKELYHTIDVGNADAIESCLNICMAESISFMDGGKTEEEKESFYHGLLIGMLKGRRGWRVKSNREAGNGRADIILIDRGKGNGHIIEVKYASEKSLLQEKALEGLDQIQHRKYNEYFIDLDIQKIHCYGIAFCKKNCKVVK